MNYRLELWKHGFLGTAEAHPLRQIQAIIRARAATLSNQERLMTREQIQALSTRELRLIRWSTNPKGRLAQQEAQWAKDELTRRARAAKQAQWAKENAMARQNRSDQ